MISAHLVNDDERDTTVAFLVDRPVMRQLALAGVTSAALGAATAGMLRAQASWARRLIGQPFGANGPATDGFYGSGPGVPITVGVLGDSTAVGLGADTPQQTAAAVCAAGMAAIAGRPVRLVNVAVVGATSLHLADQVADVRHRAPAVDVVLILVGGNDVTHRVPHRVAADHLGAAVHQLRANGAEVVVGTCPDLGTIRPVPRPLRWLARHDSRRLAAAQTVAAVQAGARTVSLGDMLGPEFHASPHDLFAADRFHPSAAGYARCGAALLPSLCAAARVWPQHMATAASTDDTVDEYTDVTDAAVDAAAHPGTELHGLPPEDGNPTALATQVPGLPHQRAIRWVLTRRRAQTA